MPLVSSSMQQYDLIVPPDVIDVEGGGDDDGDSCLTTISTNKTHKKSMAAVVVDIRNCTGTTHEKKSVRFQLPSDTDTVTTSPQQSSSGESSHLLRIGSALDKYNYIHTHHDDGNYYNSWYTKKELKSFKNEALGMANRMTMTKSLGGCYYWNIVEKKKQHRSRNDNKFNDDDVYCTRGLECRTPIGRSLKQKRRWHAKRAVFFYQKKQQSLALALARETIATTQSSFSLSYSSSSSSSSSSTSSSSTSSSLSSSSSTRNEDEQQRRHQEIVRLQNRIQKNTQQLGDIYSAYSKKSRSIASSMGQKDAQEAIRLHGQRNNNHRYHSKFDNDLRSLMTTATAASTTLQLRRNDDDSDRDDDSSTSSSSCLSTSTSSSLSVSIMITNHQNEHNHGYKNFTTSGYNNGGVNQTQVEIELINEKFQQQQQQQQQQHQEQQSSSPSSSSSSSPSFVMSWGLVLMNEFLEGGTGSSKKRTTTSTTTKHTKSKSSNSVKTKIERLAKQRLLRTSLVSFSSSSSPVSSPASCTTTARSSTVDTPIKSWLSSYTNHYQHRVKSKNKS